MKAILSGLLLASSLVSAQTQTPAPAWGQCGGTGWTGPTTCASGSACVETNAYYS